MSDLTLKLLKQSKPVDAKKWRAKIAKITRLLVAEYGTPTLGNYRDPVKEIFYIALSARTTESLYKPAFKQLWKRFGSVANIAAAPISQIRACVASAGLGNKRALQIRQIAKRLVSDFGTRSSTQLRKLSVEEAYQYLCSLPGIGPKSALCVLMYSLDFDVFPVDAHAQRIFERFGVPLQGEKHYHAQQQFPAFVPSGRSKHLHVALVVFGRLTCKPCAPSCEFCPLSDVCSTGKRYLR